MSADPFYKDHWKNIDDDRMEKYQTMFLWSDAASALYEPAGIHSGQTVADFGCGPGHTAVEIAKWVGAGGHVHALDINPSFIQQVQKNARAAGLETRVTAQECDGKSLPLETASLDRVTARNAIMYVDDPAATMREFARVLKTNGKMHAIEGDWRMMVVEPVPIDLWVKFVEAAGHACRTVDVGRKLYGLAGDAGFKERTVEIVSRPDTAGTLLPMVENMAKYARLSGTISNGNVDKVTSTVHQAISAGTYLAVLPQFVVTAAKCPA